MPFALLIIMIKNMIMHYNQYSAHAHGYRVWLGGYQGKLCAAFFHV